MRSAPGTVASSPRGRRRCREAAAPCPGAAACELFVTARRPTGTPRSWRPRAPAGAEVVRPPARSVGLVSGTVTPQGMVAVCAAVLDDREPDSCSSGPQRARRGAGARARPGQRRHRDPQRGRRGCLGRGPHRRRGRPVQRQVRAGQRRAAVPPARSSPGAAVADLVAAAARGRPRGAGRRRRGRARPRRRSTTTARSPRPTAWVFGNEAWGLPPSRPARCATRSCGCRSTDGPRASTSPPPPRSASTPPPAPSAAVPRNALRPSRSAARPAREASSARLT